MLLSRLGFPFSNIFRSVTSKEIRLALRLFRVEVISLVVMKWTIIKEVAGILDCVTAVASWVIYYINSK